MKRGALGLEPQRFPVGPLGLGIAPLSTQTQGQVRPCDDIAGAQAYRRAQRRLGLGVASLAAEGDTKVRW